MIRSDPLTTFLVERYLPAADAQDLADRVSRLAMICADLTDLPGEGPAVRYLHSVYLPSEDACFCVFAATSSAAVLAVNTAADFPLDRITAGVALLASSSGDAS